MKSFVMEFNQLGIDDVPLVGGKNASLGEMTRSLSSKGIKVPDGFATTADAFWYFLDSQGLRRLLSDKMKGLDRKDFSNLNDLSAEARQLILNAPMPSDLSEPILKAYKHLSNGRPVDVAVRSSATAEDLPDASFAGQHESYLNINGDNPLLTSIQKCFASLYTARAVKYREDKGFDHSKIALSVGVQKMVRSDKGCSGVAFTLEPESGFRDIIHLSGVWGLGENIVQGSVTPDEFFVFKPTLLLGKYPIIQKKLGAKEKTMIYAEKGVQEQVFNIITPVEKRDQFVLSDEEIIQLAQWARLIENHYGRPMDIEWAKDGVTNEVFIIQARPETVHSTKNSHHVTEYRIEAKGKSLVQGEAIGSKLAVGAARVLMSTADADKLQPGEVIVTDITSPDWDPILKKAAAIITNKGGGPAMPLLSPENLAFRR